MSASHLATIRDALLKMLSPPPRRDSMLTSLPRELRDNIFRQLIYTINEEHTTPEERSLCPKPLLRHLTGDGIFPNAPVRGIMQANAQLRAEFIQELYRLAHERSTIASEDYLIADGLPPTLVPVHPVPDPTTWTLSSLPIPFYFSQHLRSLSFTLTVPPLSDTVSTVHNLNAILQAHGVHEEPRDWNKLHDDFDAAVTAILAALPSLEELDVSLSLSSGRFVVCVPRSEAEEEELEKCLRPERVMDFRVPAMTREERPSKQVEEEEKKKKDKKEEESTTKSKHSLRRVKKRQVDDKSAKAASGYNSDLIKPAAVQPGARLKRFKKSMVIRFDGLQNLPFAFSSQEDKIENGRLVDYTWFHRSVDFFSEWSSASTCQIAVFFAVTSNTAASVEASREMSIHAVLPEMYERWYRHNGELTRDRVSQQMVELLELKTGKNRNMLAKDVLSSLLP